MNNSLNMIINYMKKENIEVSFFNDPNTIHYLTGYLSQPHERILALIVFKDSSPILFTPALEEEDAKKTVSGMNVTSYLDTQNPWQVIQGLIKAATSSYKTWAIEKQQLTVQRFEALQANFPNADFSHDFSSLIEEMRIQKTPEELEKMKIAGYWADEALKIGAQTLKEGITELEVVAEIEYQLKKRGISKMSFDTMVLFGDNAASPHGVPGNRKLNKNEFVLFDLGVVYDGYTSDVTRTMFFGDTPSQQQIDVYHTVLAAHDQAMADATLELTASELDFVARDIITKKGYGKFFNHRLGHGLGQGVHEFPSIMEGNDMLLLKNMCFSIEPGIYIQNQVGVRIEDCGYIDEDGFHSFTFFPTNISAYSEFIAK